MRYSLCSLVEEICLGNVFKHEPQCRIVDDRETLRLKNRLVEVGETLGLCAVVRPGAGGVGVEISHALTRTIKRSNR